MALCSGKRESNMPIETAYCTLCSSRPSSGFYTGCMVKDGHVKEWNCDGEGHLWRSPLIRSSEWTGIPDGWKFGFRSTSNPRDGQLPLFMTWEEFYDEKGEVVYAKVLFNSMDIPRRIQWFIDKVWRRFISDNSRCAVCKKPCDFYPSWWFKRGYCPEHCPEHNYSYDRSMREWCCEECGNPAPLDFWAYDNG